MRVVRDESAHSRDYGSVLLSLSLLVSLYPHK
jgi:hypothetical protein